MKPDQTSSYSRLTKLQLLALLSLIVVGFAVRTIALSKLPLWFDETAIFNTELFGPKPPSLVVYASHINNTTTYSRGWPAVVWLTCKALGKTATVARMPSVVFGVLGIAAAFLLVFRLARMAYAKRPFIPALFAAGLMTMSIAQIDFSQRIYPYAAVPLVTILLVLLHLEAFRLLNDDQAPLAHLTLVAGLYAAVAAFGMFVHASMYLLVAISILVIATTLLRRFFRSAATVRWGLAGGAVLFGMVILLAALLGLKNAGDAYREYLAPYYLQPGMGALRFLLTRTYDILTYNLNLVYDVKLYFPRHWNPVLLPLVALCLWGCWCAARGTYGRVARHMLLLCLACLALPAAMSLLRKFAFGGIRQTLFLSAFVLAFTALGAYSVWQKRIGRIALSAVVVGYVLLWAVYLPNFYKSRSIPFDDSRIAEVWNRNGQLKFYVDGGAGETLQYMMRRHPEIQFSEHYDAEAPNPPFFWISTHWQIEESRWFQNMSSRWQAAGYTKTLLLRIPAPYDLGNDYIQSVYFPPNGLWIYKVTKQETAIAQR